MGKKRKILQKILAGSKNIRFEEFIAVLESCGFILERINGSHHIFTHPDIDQLLPIQPRQDGKAKPYQMKQFLKLMEAHNLQLAEERDDE